MSPHQNPLPKKQTPKKRKAKSELFAKIFEKAPADELKNFLRKACNFDTDLRNLFIARFSYLIEGKKKTDYKAILKQIFQTGSRDGFIDYRDSFRVMRPVFEMLQTARELADQKEYEHCFAICSAVIENVSVAIQRMDDSSGEAGLCRLWF